jgi:hypothetical protein
MHNFLIFKSWFIWNVVNWLWFFVCPVPTVFNVTSFEVSDVVMVFIVFCVVHGM